MPHQNARWAGRVILGIMVLLGSGIGLRAQQPKRYTMSGMVLTVESSRKSFVVSHDAVPGVMAAMTMPFEVRKATELNGLTPGAIVTFTLVLEKQSAYAEKISVVRYESVEQDPLTARRLKLLKNTIGSPAAKPLAIGEAVPDFTLTDQARASVSLSGLRGKVVAVNFIYTSCVLPQFCFRTANHFDVVQKRFKARAGRDLVFLTVTFDPAHDTPEKLAEYASQWKADPKIWHFLSGGEREIQRVCDLFGVDFFPGEGLVSHSVHTAIISRTGQLVANVEGNQFTAAQLGDLVETALAH
jgi:protein SCO1/2